MGLPLATQMAKARWAICSWLSVIWMAGVWPLAGLLLPAGWLDAEIEGAEPAMLVGALAMGDEATSEAVLEVDDLAVDLRGEAMAILRKRGCES